MGEYEWTIIIAQIYDTAKCLTFIMTCSKKYLFVARDIIFPYYIYVIIR